MNKLWYEEPAQRWEEGSLTGMVLHPHRSVATKVCYGDKEWQISLIKGQDFLLEL